MGFVLTNMPRRGGPRLVATADDGIYRIVTEEGRGVCTVDAATPEGRARQIASLLEEAREIGFKQGLASVRAALGLG